MSANGTADRISKDAAPPDITVRTISEWVLDFVGPFKPPAMRTGNRYVIVATDYYTNWIKPKPCAITPRRRRRNSCMNTFGAGMDVR